jgi:hypothetical protein
VFYLTQKTFLSPFEELFCSYSLQFPFWAFNFEQNICESKGFHCCSVQSAVDAFLPCHHVGMDFCFALGTGNFFRARWFPCCPMCMTLLLFTTMLSEMANSSCKSTNADMLNSRVLIEHFWFVCLCVWLHAFSWKIQQWERESLQYWRLGLNLIRAQLHKYLGLPNVWKEMAVIPPSLMFMQGKQMCPIP